MFVSETFEKNELIALIARKRKTIPINIIVMKTTLKSKRVWSYLGSVEDNEECLISSLSLASNKHSKEEINELASVLEKNTSLTSLNLRDSYVSNEELEILMNGLMKNSALKKLDLSSNEFDDNGLSCLNNYLESNESLTKIDLSDNDISEHGVLKLLPSLRKHRFCSFKVHNSNIKDAGFINLIDSLKTSKYRNELENFVFHENELTIEGANYFSRSLESFCNLKQIDFCGIPYKNEGALCLGSYITHLKKLESISFCENGIKKEGMCELISKLKQCCNLKKFETNWNKIGDEAFFSICDFVKSTSSLKQLILNQTRATITAFNTLFTQLETNKTLEVLKIGDYTDYLFTRENTEPLRKCLLNNNTLTELSLPKRLIFTSDSVQCITESLKTNSTIKNLSIFYGELTFSELKNIFNALKINRSITFLRLSHSNIPNFHYDDIRNLLICNRPWSFDTHNIFKLTSFVSPNDFHDCVFTFLLCVKRVFLKHSFRIPKPVLYMIIGFIDKKSFMLSNQCTNKRSHESEEEGEFVEPPLKKTKN